MVYKYSQEMKRLGRLYLAEDHYLYSDVRPGVAGENQVVEKKHLPASGAWRKTIRAIPANKNSY